MPRDGNITRDKILTTSMNLAISQGHVATPIDEVIAQVGITKGTFFYHFPSKKHLAMAMIERFSDTKINTLNDFMEKAEQESDDPLQQLLSFVTLVQAQHAQLEREEIGCLYASYCYENQLVDKDIAEMVASTMKKWKDRLTEKVALAMTLYPSLAGEIEAEKVAGMFWATLEGAYIVARVTPEHNAVEVYLEQYKHYLQVLFR